MQTAKLNVSNFDIPSKVESIQKELAPLAVDGYHAAAKNGEAIGPVAETIREEPNDPLADLLSETANGDQGAFKKLYNETASILMSICFRVLGRRDWAEEVLQEAYLRIWRGANSYHPGRGAPITWMGSIARNASIDRLRQLRRESNVIESTSDERPEPTANLLDEVLKNDSARRLASCLAKLEEGPRQAIVLAYCFGYSHEELSENMSVALGTAKSWIRRGLLKLRACMES